jgi:hypothetical protein
MLRYLTPLQAAYMQVGRVFFKKPAAVCVEKLKGDRPVAPRLPPCHALAEREADCVQQLAALRGNAEK